LLASGEGRCSVESALEQFVYWNLFRFLYKKMYV
jgi:hypothetical protein